MSLAQTDQTSQTASNKSSGSNTGGSRAGITNNFAMGGSSLSASQSAGGVPSWLWAVLVGVAAVVGIWIWMRRKS